MGRVSPASRAPPRIAGFRLTEGWGTISASRGASTCTLGNAAKASRVFKPLVYKYFPSREALLGALRLGKVELDRAADFWTAFTLAGWDAVGQTFRHLAVSWLRSRFDKTALAALRVARLAMRQSRLRSYCEPY